ncbi:MULTISPECIES: AAA family ATPase [Cronobacter]|nr:MULTISPECIES: AAA family ATPase [Cronobacter]CCK02746.1 ABC transporter ATP-binding protein [Cronobacter sakazakii 701]ELY5829651.1 AAA family ATPase [Cronobacter turicensis]MEB8538779.1 AAA family ATPase [Cronobacter sakazakii]TWR38562.1 AAA family ATPase [Cronobacter sakazakii]HAU5438876.1 AAA family ATPase [Cronobacter sakazakii]
MDIEVRNFGTIADAHVHIGGLTVITGENDTGKSTVGKILFSIVKAIARYEFDLEEDKDARLLSLAEALYFSIIRRAINIATNTQIRDLFHPKKFINHIKIDPNYALKERYNALNRLLDHGDIAEIMYSSASSKLEEIRQLIEEPDDRFSVMNRAIGKAFFSEFRGEIVPRGNEIPLKPVVKVNDGATPLIEINWVGDTKFKFDFNDELGYSDATYVESPAIIQYHNLAQMSKTLFEIKEGVTGRATVPLHIKDLSNKLSDSIYNLYAFNDLFGEMEPDLHSQISSRINNAFNGEIIYDNEKFDFLLTRESYSISSSNVASGVKSLGILDMLLKGGHAENNQLLILDEPEVNLHPKWQILYCELICDLVYSGVDIIITTHSPYIIDALKHFADKKRIEHSFYLATKYPGESLTSFLNITDDISHAIDLLAEPLRVLSKDDFDDF